MYDGRAEWSETWPILSGVSVEVPDLPAAARSVAFFNPADGSGIGALYTIPTVSATTTIPLPDFAGDIALRISSSASVPIAHLQPHAGVPEIAVRGGRLDVSLHDRAGGRIDLLSLDGRCLRSASVPAGAVGGSVPLNGLASGIYLVRVPGCRPVKAVLDGVRYP